MTDRRIGVVLCQCGGNISDYVDTEKLRAAAAEEPGVVSAHVQMFACSDAAQQETVREIREKKLDGIVVCSCSPKLHLTTFRAMAQRAGLNPYQYTQVNVREQCSWAHTHDRPAATEKAVRLARAGIARTARSEPLERMRVETTPQSLVIGAGVAGLRAALALSELGIAVHLVERASEPGGQTARWGTLFPNDRTGPALVRTLLDELHRRENIALYTSTELVEKSGRVGAFSVTLRSSAGVATTLEVGSIIVATGFEPYSPSRGEYGYGLEGVLTLPELKERLASSSEGLRSHGRPVRSIAYIYCVGSREGHLEGSPRSYCSRYCCSATSHLSALLGNREPGLRQFHLFRDVRTYGKYELLYERALASGGLFLRYGEDAPPQVTEEGGGLVVRVRDSLTGGEPLELRPDLVVLVTGMVPRENDRLNEVLKLPLGKDGFLNEIHIKLRPVETVANGIFIAGTAQGPKNIAESVASAMAAVSKTGALLLKGYVDLDPLVARVDPELCEWCGECLAACPYGAVEQVPASGKSVAKVNPVLCKGEGACVPVCPKQALEVQGFTHSQLTAAIDALAREVASS